MRLVEVDDSGHDDVRMYGLSTFDTRFLYNEIVRARSYGDLDLPEGALVVDVGANIGMFVLYVKDRCPDAQVLAFEPSPDAVAALRRNIEHLGFDDVVVHQVALGRDVDLRAPFTYYPLLPSSSTRYPHEQERLKRRLSRSFPPRVVERMYRGRQMAVTADRLSAFLPPDRTVDLLKIDVVGSELDVLAGVDQERWGSIRQVVLDVQDVSGRVAAVCELLRRHGLETSVQPAPLAQDDGLNYLVHAGQR